MNDASATARGASPSVPASGGWSVFISYSRASSAAQAEWLRLALEASGLSVFKDTAVLRGGDRWLESIDDALSRCRQFAVLLGPEGLTRWVGGETAVALTRHFSARHEGERPRILPVLMPGASPLVESSALLAQFQSVAWPAEEAGVPAAVLAAITRPLAVASPPAISIQGCPYRGLETFQPVDARLFFGRERDVLACLERLGEPSPRQPGAVVMRGQQYRRWLSIVGGSGAGKSSLMRAGLLPLIQAGALSARTGYDDWVVTPPMLPGAEPVRQLAQVLSAALLPVAQRDSNALADRLANGNEHALSDWVADRLADHPGRAMLLVIDQFEELFTLSSAEQRARFDALLTTALTATETRLHLLSTCRSDFAPRIAEELARLGPLCNELGRTYTLAPMRMDDLRRAIEQPAALAGLDVSEIVQAVLDDARDDMAGALPLVQHALATLWNEPRPGTEAQRLSFSAYERAGRLAGMVAREADAVLEGLGRQSPEHRKGALELLLALSHYQPDGRHTRQHLPRDAAVRQAGLGNTKRGEAVLMALSPRTGLRLVTVSDDGASTRVDLIHEALLRTPASKDGPAGSKSELARAYWPTLVEFLVRNKDRALQRQNLAHAAESRARAGWLGRWAAFTGPTELRRWWPLRYLADANERRYLRHSLVMDATLTMVFIAATAGLFYGVAWAESRGLPLRYIGKAIVWTLSSDRDVPTVVPIPPGRFVMGCLKGRDDVQGIACDNDDRTTREVVMDAPCEMGTHEVTFEQFDQFVFAVGEQWRGRDLSMPAYPPDPTGRRGHVPVVNVSWFDAMAYTRWLSTTTRQAWRLPSEEEWEYAARGIHPSKPGGTEGPYWWGSASPKADGGKPGRANCAGCDLRFNGRSSPVGSYGANAFGIWDTVGNVWEWTGSGLDFRALPDFNDAMVPRVLRGGSWYGGPSGARASNRSGFGPVLRNFNVGFRVCRASPIGPLDAAPAGR